MLIVFIFIVTSMVFMNIVIIYHGERLNLALSNGNTLIPLVIIKISREFMPVSEINSPSVIALHLSFV